MQIQYLCFEGFLFGFFFDNIQMKYKIYLTTILVKNTLMYTTCTLTGLKLEEKQLTRYYKQEQIILEI